MALSMSASVEGLHLSYQRCLRYAIGAITQRNPAEEKNNAGFQLLQSLSVTFRSELRLSGIFRFPC